MMDSRCKHGIGAAHTCAACLNEAFEARTKATANELMVYARRHAYFGSNSQSQIIQISQLEAFFK